MPYLAYGVGLAAVAIASAVFVRVNSTVLYLISKSLRVIYELRINVQW
jgi:hypothetical protein